MAFTTKSASDSAAITAKKTELFRRFLFTRVLLSVGVPGLSMPVIIQSAVGARWITAGVAWRW
ncbi:hypothetical protein A5689_19500 [Mycobacterium intracellulare subsp. yongonense]|nr:hypothetical protein A5689_19500 [Mycobacterium intracellulare subsp. yongonense]